MVPFAGLGSPDTLSASATFEVVAETTDAEAAPAAGGLEPADDLLEDVFGAVATADLGAAADKLETATVLPEFDFVVRFLLAELVALVESADFVLLLCAGTAFAAEVVPSEALAAGPAEVCALGLACECAAIGWDSGCF